MLKNKKILLGISGSIAAYKSILLTRELKKLGAEVKVILTDSALDFVTPTTLSTLSENPVYSSFFKNKENGEWVNHVHLGKWADLFIIAPLSANTLSKLVSGNCDNLLIATYLSADCKVMVAPAMDLDMYSHFTTQQNLDTLRTKHIDVLDAGEGSLASGLVGKGRMAEPEEIIAAATAYFSTKYKVSGKRVIVTAGPTYEAIDPVRFIGNHSSGKMGYRIADELAGRGAIVTLVSGPSSQVSQANVETLRVVSAKDMLDATVSRFDDCDLIIMAAAVADYTPKTVATKKMKKESTEINVIELTPTVDILKHQKLVGFALETDNELANAKSKLMRKNLDMLVLNSLNDKGAGFGTDTNKVTFVFHESIKEFSLKNKEDVAVDIANEVESFF